MKITPLSSQELENTYTIIEDSYTGGTDTPPNCTLAELRELIKNDTFAGESTDHAGMLAVRYESHPEYGDVIIITTAESGGIMIHA